MIEKVYNNIKTNFENDIDNLSWNEAIDRLDSNLINLFESSLDIDYFDDLVLYVDIYKKAYALKKYQDDAYADKNEGNAFKIREFAIKLINNWFEENKPKIKLPEWIKDLLDYQKEHQILTDKIQDSDINIKPTTIFNKPFEIKINTGIEVLIEELEITKVDNYGTITRAYFDDDEYGTIEFYQVNKEKSIGGAEK